MERGMAADDATGLHVKNFIECVRTRNRPTADVETGHRSTVVAHLGNITFRTGRKIIGNRERGNRRRCRSLNFWAGRRAQAMGPDL